MNITFYNNYSDNRNVNKNLSLIKSIDCKIKDGCKMTNPVVIIARSALSNWNNVNYAFIDTFQRYYYIENVTVTTADLIEIEMRVDVLQSFAGSIKSLNGIILRQENVNNKYIPDDKSPVRVQRIISYKKIGTLGDGTGIALTVNGGVNEV